MVSSQGLFHSLVALFVCFTSLAFAAFPITGTHSNGVQPRLEIRTLAANPNQWNIYLLALTAFHAENQDSTTSYYQISGIHGVPYKPWDGVQRTAALTGYCTHSMNLFPTWHRPYIALFEQRLTYHAKQVAQQFKGSNRQAMITAANNLRQPFWDWAEMPASGRPNFPTVLQQKYVTVNAPTGRKTIVNPLFRYDFHPMTPGIFAQPWSTWPQTLRWPTSSAKTASSQEGKAATTIHNQARSQRAGLYQWFTNCKNYLEASNDEKSSTSPGCHISLESLHNNIHVWVGGTVNPQGHMTIIPYSGFDPSFMLHHTQIDRLFAMWQQVYPSSYITPQKASSSTFTIARGSVQGGSSPLKPFHRTASGEFWTSDAVRNHRIFGYTYPDFLQGGNSAAGMRARINKLYGPKASIHAAAFKRDEPPTVTPLIAPNNTRYEYIANIATSRFGLNGTYTIYMFLGTPASEDPVDWPLDPALAGSYGVFSEPNMEDSDIITTSAVSLTAPLADKVLGGLLGDLTELIVVPYLTNALTWRISGPTGAAVDPSDVPDLNISVLSSTTTIPEDPTVFPEWSDFITLPAITHGKPGGLLQEIGSAIGQALGGGSGSS